MRFPARTIESLHFLYYIILCTRAVPVPIRIIILYRYVVYPRVWYKVYGIGYIQYIGTCISYSRR